MPTWLPKTCTRDLSPLVRKGVDFHFHAKVNFKHETKQELYYGWERSELAVLETTGECQFSNKVNFNEYLHCITHRQMLMTNEPLQHKPKNDDDSAHNLVNMQFQLRITGIILSTLALKNQFDTFLFDECAKIDSSTSAPFLNLKGKS